MDAEEWLAGYRDRLTELGARAGRAQDALAHAEATATSPDGAVTVTVNPAGALRDLVLSERTTGMSRVQLAAAVLDTAAAAQADAARRGLAAMEPVLGKDSSTMRMLRTQLTTGGRP